MLSTVHAKYSAYSTIATVVHGASCQRACNPAAASASADTSPIAHRTRSRAPRTAAWTRNRVRRCAPGGHTQHRNATCSAE